jgi:phosphate transport system protein
VNANSHLEETVRRGIEAIRDKVAQMATLAEGALERSLEALAGRDGQRAYAVILQDRYIDELETELDRLCLEFLVRQQPAGAHLRFVFTTIKVNKEIERIGDYAESVARQVLLVTRSDSALPPLDRLTELGTLALHMFRDAIAALLTRDAGLARRTMAIEERGNALRNQINEDLLRLEREGRLAIEMLTPLMTIARRFERVTDQTKNLCEEVLYLCTGEFIKHPGNEAFRVLFVDADNRCLSQMAEAIGNALALPGFVFASAGLAPVAIDARLVEFMARKGIDISQQTSKTCEQVPNAEHYQVVIALSAEGRKAFPPPPTKTICLTWTTADPIGAPGPHAAESAFESAYKFLDGHVRDLVAAARPEPAKPRSQ